MHSDHSAVVKALLEHGGLQREPRFKQWQYCLLDGVLRAGQPSGEQGEDRTSDVCCLLSVKTVQGKARFY
jgi:hypothetical protein